MEHKQRTLENLVSMWDHLVKTYKNRRVFVTGHTGFKGSWMIQLLSMLGAEIGGYALAPETSEDLYHLIDGDHICASVIGDLRDLPLLKQSIQAFQPDMIFHMAAQPLVRLSYEIPVETFGVNVMGTANLLDVVRTLDKKCEVVLITTDKVYYNNEWVYPYREEDRLGGYDPYSASKACAELVIDSYRNAFFNPVQYSAHQKCIASARAGNVIGGGDWAKDRLLPDIARALGRQKEITLRNPNSVRPWQHVLEPLCGYLMLGAKMTESALAYGKAYNFGPYAEDALPVEVMAQIALQIWGSGEYQVVPSNSPVHEAGLLKLDISRSVQELQWRPKLRAAQALEYTIDWYKQYFSGDTDMKDITKKQILNYLHA